MRSCTTFKTRVNLIHQARRLEELIADIKQDLNTTVILDLKNLQFRNVLV